MKVAEKTNMHTYVLSEHFLTIQKHNQNDKHINRSLK